ncbi:MAG: hypothetical protein JSR65_05895 [Proteobacteria bacterium]|nr:hypothetical protein [Pseudomonadota bacterium]
MNTLYLGNLKAMLPQRAAARSGSPIASAEAMRAWLEAMPLADRSFVMLRLHEVLRSFNAALVAPPERLAMLDMLEHACVPLVDDARNEVREFYPLSPERHEEMRLADTIEHEMMLGHVEVVCDLCLPSGRVPFMRRGTIAKSLVRAATHQATRLWLALKMHRDPPAGAWQGLHDLFRFAVTAGCADRVGASSTQGVKISVRSVYTQALLLAFAKPRQLTQAQNRQMYTALPVLASWCATNQGHAPAGAIMVFADGDRSPPVMPRGGQIGTDDCWMLDIADLLARFDALLSTSEGEGRIVLPARHGEGRATLDVALTQTLRRVWSERVERGVERKADRSRFETEVGLTSLHFILSGDRDFDSVLPLGAETSVATASWAQSTSTRGATRRAHAEAVDRSAHGFRLRWSADEDARARVGELIALAPVAARDAQWRFGILRWLRTDGSAGVEAGVELLSSPVPMAVYVLDANGASRPPMRGILVAGNEDRGDDRSGILVPRPFARDAAALEVMRIESDPDGPVSRPVRIARFDVRESGLYQKILISDEEMERIECA